MSSDELDLELSGSETELEYMEVSSDVGNDRKVVMLSSDPDILMIDDEPEHDDEAEHMVYSKVCIETQSLEQM